MPGRDFDRIADRAVLDQGFGERRALYRGIGDDAGAGTARDRPGLEHRQVRGTRRGRQGGRVLVDLVDELAGEVVEHALAIGLRLFLRELVAHLLERNGIACAKLAQLDHVPAEIGLDRANHLASLHPEQRILERLAERAGLFDPTQVAAGRLRADIVGMLARERREIGAGRLGQRGDPVRLVFGRLLGRGVGTRGHLHQDVRRQPLLRLGET